MSKRMALGLVEEPYASREIRRALLTLLADKDAIRAHFERACAEGIFVLRDDEPAFRSALSAQGENYRHDEIESVLYGLALELLPASAAAGWERLQRRRRERDKGPGGIRSDATAVVSLEDLLYEEHAYLKDLYHLVAALPPDYESLRQETAKVWAALRRRGEVYSGKHFTDFAHAVVSGLYPLSPGVRWDTEWADDVARRGLASVRERASSRAYSSEPKEVVDAEEEILAAAQVNDRRRYRHAVRAWVGAVADVEETREA